MKEALRRAIAIRDGINRKTGVNDKTITDGVNKLSHDKTIILPQLQIIDNPKDTDIIFDDSPFEDLEYLESTGSQYIDTGFTPTPNTRVVIDFEYTTEQTSDAQIMGCGYNNVSSNSGRFSFFFGKESPNNATNPNEFYVNMVNSSNYSWHHFGFWDLNRHVWDLQSGLQKIDNVEYGTQSISSDKTSNLNLYLFGRINSWDSSHNYCKMKLYSCQIYDNNILVRDYSAKRHKYTKAIGLFDEVNQNLNTGSGTFTPGPVVNGGD